MDVYTMHAHTSVYIGCNNNNKEEEEEAKKRPENRNEKTVHRNIQEFNGEKKERISEANSMEPTCETKTFFFFLFLGSFSLFRLLPLQSFYI